MRGARIQPPKKEIMHRVTDRTCVAWAEGGRHDDGDDGTMLMTIIMCGRTSRTGTTVLYIL